MDDGQVFQKGMVTKEKKEKLAKHKKVEQNGKVNTISLLSCEDPRKCISKIWC
jgi:hypothetical protein